MMINEISAHECRAVLERASVGRLGCALNNEPYVVPIADDEKDLYDKQRIRATA